MLCSITFGVISLLGLSHVTASPTTRDIQTSVNTTTCNGKTYVYEELAGWGLFPSDARDKFGDTVGGVGSAIALDKKSWKKKKLGTKEAYKGIIYGLPDRGWNTEGTQNTQSRIHKFGISLEIVEASKSNPAAPNVKLEYLDTILLSDPEGNPCTGLDADVKETIKFKGFPDLPVAIYTGDGFGGSGDGGKRVALDTEGLVLGDDGSFWISDEYGAYVYQFDQNGIMTDAIRPPDALIPLRNGTQSFNAASPPIYNPAQVTVPEKPDTGRNNNQGMEGLTASPDGKYLYALLQTATIQDGGNKATTRRNTRLFKYRIGRKKTELEGEWVVQLPLVPGSGKVAGQSEIYYISDTQFLVLARDGDAGAGKEVTESKYRNADVIDISKATDINKKKYNKADGAIASKDGVLNSDITPATYCPWLSYNNNDQLNRFGAHNGGQQDTGLLNEKWEGLALAPVDREFSRKGDGDEYYLISFSDNDFITQNGFINFGQNQYQDSSGFSLNTQVLVFKVRLPKGAKPL